jgi:RNA polymerase sigma factor (sigma-70 family)
VRIDLGEFVEANRPRLLGKLARLTGDRDAADDLLQDTLLRLLQSGRSEIEAESPFGYLLVCARFLYISQMGRMQWRKKITEYWQPPPRMTVEDHGRTYEHWQQSLWALKEISEMNRVPKKVMFLKTVHELTTQEIVRLTGMSRGAVDGNICQARKRLRGLLP